MDKHVRKNHRKIAKNIIASKTELNFLTEIPDFNDNKHDWLGIFTNVHNIWFVIYSDQSQTYVVTCYNSAWIECYMLEEIPDKYKEA